MRPEPREDFVGDQERSVCPDLRGQVLHESWRRNAHARPSLHGLDDDGPGRHCRGFGAVSALRRRRAGRAHHRLQADLGLGRRLGKGDERDVVREALGERAAKVAPVGGRQRA